MMKIGNREFDFNNHTYVMGILNVTPDSFSDGGNYCDVDCAVARAMEMVDEGADIIDIGAQSTRPGYVECGAEQEMQRIVPVLEKLRKTVSIPLSIDTYRADVAEACLNIGADIINDVSALSDKGMARIVSDNDAVYVMMHGFGGEIAEDYDSADEYVARVIEEISSAVRRATDAGIDSGRLIVDCGIGFGKSQKQNLMLLKHMDRLADMPYPVLLGASRKSVIGNVLELDVTQRLEGTIVTSALAVHNHIGIIRVHDVKENVRAVKMAEAISRSE